MDINEFTIEMLINVLKGTSDLPAEDQANIKYAFSQFLKNNGGNLND